MSLKFQSSIIFSPGVMMGQIPPSPPQLWYCPVCMSQFWILLYKTKTIKDKWVIFPGQHSNIISMGVIRSQIPPSSHRILITQFIFFQFTTPKTPSTPA